MSGFPTDRPLSAGLRFAQMLVRQAFIGGADHEACHIKVLGRKIVKETAVMLFRSIWFGVSTVATVAGLVLAISWAAAQTEDGDEVLRPKRHFALERPGDLTKADAIKVYDEIADEMARGYAVSGDPTALAYRKWRRYNDASYRSESHGNRYVNNYANAIARRAGYGDPKEGVDMPAGAILAKDSFTYTADHELFAGALFIMEKLPAGDNPAMADWRYAMIMPDGSVFGDTNADTAERMKFCHECHEQRAAFDYLFFVPEEYRRRFPNN